MSEQIQDGPTPKPKKKRKRIKKIKISTGPSESGDFNKRVYFDCNEPVDEKDIHVINAISVENTGISDAEEFHLDTPIAPNSFYMLDDNEGTIRGKITKLINEGKTSSLSITFNDGFAPEEETYEVSFEM